MNLYYTTKSWLKIARWQARRGIVSLRWGPGELARMPVVLGNSMPKSGSHLIIQVLHGLTRLGAFVNPGFPPVNRSEDNHKLPAEAVLENIQRMRPGDIGYGYVHAAEPFLSALTRAGRATVFVYRDPRDVIISHVFYATEMHEEHGMHHYYTKVLKSMEERINAAIQGVEQPGTELNSIRAKYDNYLGWREQPEMLCLRFEDMILNQEAALGRLLDYLAERGFNPKASRSAAVAMIQSAIHPRRSGTYRKAKPGNWQEHFTPANKVLFKECTGDLLMQLGYEENNDW